MIGNVSFKGTFSVKGSNSDVLDVQKQLLNHIKSEDMFTKIVSPLEGETTQFFANGKESGLLQRFYKNCGGALGTFESMVGLENINRFMTQHKTITAKEVLEAMNKGLFDFVNLAIKK